MSESQFSFGGHLVLGPSTGGFLPTALGTRSRSTRSYARKGSFKYVSWHGEEEINGSRCLISYLFERVLAASSDVLFCCCAGFLKVVGRFFKSSCRPPCSDFLFKGAFSVTRLVQN